MKMWGKVFLIMLVLAVAGLWIVLPLFLLLSIRIVFEYQRGVVFTLGRYDGLLQPGFNLLVPLVQRTEIIDLRLRVDDVAEQTPITKDNVSVKVDAVIYYRVNKDEAQNAVIKVEHYEYALNQLAQTTMKNIIGEVTLDEVLSRRDELSNKIREIVDKATDPWGIKVENVELKHIELPESMKTIMARAAEAERLKRAAIIKAEGEVKASELVSKAADKMHGAPGGIDLRTLQGLDDIASDKSNEVVFFIPLDMMHSMKGNGADKK